MESPRFYILDWQQLSYREHWALSPGWRGLKRYFAVWLGGSGNKPPIITSFTPMQGHVRPVNQLPPELREVATPWIVEACGYGFREIGAVEIDNPFSAAIRFRVALRHSTGHAGLILSCHWLPGSPGNVFPTLITRLDDRGWARTQSVPALRPPPMGRDFCEPAPTLDAFWEAHKLNVTTVRSATPDPFVTAEDFLTFSDHVDVTELEWNRARGVFRPLSPKRAAILRARAQSERQQRLVLAPGGAECHPIHTALSRKRHPSRPSLAGTVVAAAVVWGLLAFLGKWGWSELGPLLLLAGGILLHEGGHRLGRRIELRYDSPLAPYVELFMGPLPGLLLGIFCLTVTPFPRCGLALTLLNLLTLVPIPPMDGARFVRLAIFSHHPWLAPAANLFAMAALILAGWLTASWIPFVVALFLMLLLPAQFRLAHLTPLAQMHFGNHDQNEPLKPEVTLSLVTAIREVFPNGNNPDFLQDTATRLYEIGTVRPPSRKRTVHLSALYSAAILLAAVASTFRLVETPLLTRLAQTPERSPRAVAANEDDFSRLPIRRALPANSSGEDALEEALAEVATQRPVAQPAQPQPTRLAPTPQPVAPQPGDALEEALAELAEQRPAPTPLITPQPPAAVEPPAETQPPVVREIPPEVAKLSPLVPPHPILASSGTTATAEEASLALPSAERPKEGALLEALLEMAVLPPAIGNALDDVLKTIGEMPRSVPVATPSAIAEPSAPSTAEFPPTAIASPSPTASEPQAAQPTASPTTDAIAEALAEVAAQPTPAAPRPVGNALDEALQEVATPSPSPVHRTDALQEALDEIIPTAAP